MEQRPLGRSDIKISPIVMGTWQAGKNMWVGIDDKATTRAMQTAFDNGITTFDTAEVYGDGHSERIMGNALADVRQQAVYASKVFANHLQHDQVIEACHCSLKNLKTDYIDLYQIHWPTGSFGNPKVPLEETFRALNQLKQEGKIRAVGVSNFSRDQMEEAAPYGRVDSLQPPYSLFWRHVDNDQQPYCIENDITIMAYSPLAQGILTGKFGPNHQFDKGDHRSKNRLFHPDIYPKIQQALKKLAPIADQYEANLAQLALAWVCAQPQTVAIAGARNPDQVHQNAVAASLVISPDTLAQMVEISQEVIDLLDDDPVQWKW